MSAFAIFVIIQATLYAIYYVFQIMKDTYGENGKNKTDIEVFDVSQVHCSDEPIIITENMYGLQFEDSRDAKLNEDHELTFIETDQDVAEYQEKVQLPHEQRIKAEAECAKLRNSLEPIETFSSGGTESSVMLDLLVHQKPGGPKIFLKREML